MLALFGVTTSSLKLNFSTAKNNSANVLWAHPQSIRSDEWIRSTPSALAQFQPNWTKNNLTPFEVGNFKERASFVSSIEKVVFFEQTIVQNLKSFKAFAALWWLPFFGTLIFGYLFLKEIGLRKNTSILGPVLIVASGPVVWWSFSVLTILYPAFAGSYFLIKALNKPEKNAGKSSNILRTSLLIFGSSIFLARMPWLYAPWSIPITLSFAFLLLPLLFYKREIKNTLKIIVPQATLLILLSLLIFISRQDRFLALNETIYPGQRRSGGGANGINQSLTWSGPFAWVLQSQNNSKLVNSNLSEIARGLTILVVPTFLMVVQSIRKSIRDLRVIIASINLVFILICLGWERFIWPNKFIFGYLFGFVPGERMSQIVGVLVIIPFVLMLDVHYDEINSRWVKSSTIVGFFTVGFLVLTSGTSLKNNFVPSISGLKIALTALIFSTLCVSFYFLKEKYFYLLLCIISLVSVSRVNPITVGSGDLLKSKASHIVGSIKHSDENGRWATDDLFTDALVSASGAPMLPGQQFWGPNKEVWQLIDPDQKNSSVWNRGASSIVTRWDVGLLQAKFESPQDDLIVLTLNPCMSELEIFNLKFVMSSFPLDALCLTLRSKIKWNGIDRWIYERNML